MLFMTSIIATVPQRLEHTENTQEQEYNHHLVPPRLPRYDRRKQEAEDSARRDRIIDESEDTPPPGDRAIGSWRDLRGLPVVGAGGGAVHGSNPVQALLAKVAMAVGVRPGKPVMETGRTVALRHAQPSLCYFTSIQPYMLNSAKCGAKLHRTK